MKLWPHQQRAFDFLLPRTSGLLASPPGTGKSAVAVALHDTCGCDLSLVVCPTTVRPVWRREFARHGAAGTRVVVLDQGSIRKRTEEARRAVDEATRPMVIVANYESVWREPFRTWSLEQAWDAVFLDESHRVMKESRISAYCGELRDHTRRRLCLTGTPLTQDPASVWAQCRFLDGTIFGSNYSVFMETFHNPVALDARKGLLSYNERMVRAGQPRLIVPDEMLAGTINTEEYMRRLSAVTFRVEGNVLGLPEMVTERREVCMGPAARRLYDALASGHRHEIDTGLWNTPEAMYAIPLRLQQITSGWYRDEDEKSVRVDRAKEMALADILDGCGGEPVVVVSRFVRDIEVIRGVAARLGLSYGEISGRSKDGLDASGRMADGIQVLAVQQQAGNAGVDLTRARIMVFYSLTWSLAEYDQSVARIRRAEQTRPTIAYQLVAKDSIDEALFRTLDARRQLVGHVCRAIERASGEVFEPHDDVQRSPPRYSTTPASCIGYPQTTLSEGSCTAPAPAGSCSTHRPTPQPVAWSDSLEGSRPQADAATARTYAASEE